MKDRLGKAWFVNLPPKNPTQTRYTRFLRGPEGEIKTGFTSAKAEWDDRLKNALRTPWAELFLDDKRG